MTKRKNNSNFYPVQKKIEKENDEDEDEEQNIIEDYEEDFHLSQIIEYNSEDYNISSKRELTKKNLPSIIQTGFHLFTQQSNVDVLGFPGEPLKIGQKVMLNITFTEEYKEKNGDNITQLNGFITKIVNQCVIVVKIEENNKITDLEGKWIAILQQELGRVNQWNLHSLLPCDNLDKFKDQEITLTEQDVYQNVIRELDLEKISDEIIVKNYKTSIEGSILAKMVYQIKIELVGSKPPIWRTLQIQGNTPFKSLHEAINLTMGWGGKYCHEFLMRGESVGVLQDREEKLSLSSLAFQKGEHFSYIYDLEERWNHNIIVEKIFNQQMDVIYPLCIDGENACPPEDCGGISGYIALLDEYNQNMFKWISEKVGPTNESCSSGEFDPSCFSVSKVNEHFRPTRPQDIVAILAQLVRARYNL